MKVLLDDTPPDADIAIAIKRTNRLLTTRRGRDPLAVASLASCRQKLMAAAADLKIFNHREAVRCRAMEPTPPETEPHT